MKPDVSIDLHLNLNIFWYCRMMELEEIIKKTFVATISFYGKQYYKTKKGALPRPSKGIKGKTN